MQSAKETAANVAASAKSGFEKTKAVVGEKVERITARNPTEKEIATEKMEERIHQAERNKQEARLQNATARQAAEIGGVHSYSTTGAVGQPTGAHQMSALPGHGTGKPTGQVIEGIVQSHPIGTATGTTRSTTAHNTEVGGGANQGYSTGGGYSG